MVKGLYYALVILLNVVNICTSIKSIYIGSIENTLLAKGKAINSNIEQHTEPTISLTCSC